MQALKKIIVVLLSLHCMGFAGCGISSMNSQPDIPQQSITESSEQLDVSDKTESTPESAEPSKEVSETTESIDEDSKVESASKPDKENSKTEPSKTDISKTESSKQQENSKTSDVSKTGQTSQTSKPAESSKPSQTSQSSKHDETSKPAEQSKPAETSKLSQASTPSQPSKPTVVNVSSISLNKSSLTLTVGESSRLIATINPNNATDKGFLWINSNTSVVSIDGNGNVKALKAGTATITAKSNNGKTASCNITVKAKETSQPAKKITKFKLDCEGMTHGSTVLGLEVAPVGADISNLKINFQNNGNGLLAFDKIKKDTVQPQHGQSECYNIYLKSQKPSQDTKIYCTVSCDGLSSSTTIILKSDYDARYANYYPPFTQEKIKAIEQDMINYGLSKGFQYDDSLWLKWNGSKYTCNCSFNFPVTTELNTPGMSLYEELMHSVDYAYETACESDGEIFDPHLMFFKIFTRKTTGAMGQEVWQFYVLN